ncbi:hypothetical protein LC608_18995 [Nostoc sp. XA010]|uniref:hypothetical protein n=1 Tax=Nostoc sp. XA010 TaxID=2780407 RepID=UPI001E3345CC|nr:hypothetical protein [Nostoc sp. XA010]MCC5659023.1 hypothetical protein [Nostoc sp. XA010]
MDSERIQPSLTPIGDIGGTAGYAARPATDSATKAVSAGFDFGDSLLMDKLCDRVYELLLEDMRSQRERVRNYGSTRW